MFIVRKSTGKNAVIANTKDEKLPMFIMRKAPVEAKGKYICSLNDEAIKLLGYNTITNTTQVFVVPTEDNTYVICHEDFSTVLDAMIEAEELSKKAAKAMVAKLAGNGNISNKDMYADMTANLGLANTEEHFFQLFKVEDADSNFVYANLVKTTEENYLNKVSADAVVTEFKEVVQVDEIVVGFQQAEEVQEAEVKATEVLF